MFFKLQFPPGLFRNGTSYQSAGRFYDANLVRFFEGQIRPMKGWATGLTGTLSGNPRAAHAWKTNEGDSFAAFGTHTKLYAHNGTTLEDITSSAGVAAVELLTEDGTTEIFTEESVTLMAETGFNGGDANTSTWTLDNFGELLVACNDAENAIYEWQPGGGLDATEITNAPQADAVFVTEQRFIVALGADGDARRVAWNDQENRTVWSAESTNQAGDLNLQTAGVIMCGGKVRGGGLIWTDLDLHLMRYQGFPDIYGIERVGNDCGIIGRHAFQIVDSVAYWMGQNGFWRYVGYVEPLPCEISDDVFTNINTTYRSKVWCQHYPQFGKCISFILGARRPSARTRPSITTAKTTGTTLNWPGTVGSQKGHLTTPSWSNPRAKCSSTNTAGPMTARCARLCLDRSRSGTASAGFRSMSSFPTSPRRAIAKSTSIPARRLTPQRPRLGHTTPLIALA